MQSTVALGERAKLAILDISIALKSSVKYHIPTTTHDACDGVTTTAVEIETAYCSDIRSETLSYLFLQFMPQFARPVLFDSIVVAFHHLTRRYQIYFLVKRKRGRS